MSEEVEKICGTCRWFYPLRFNKTRGICALKWVRKKAHERCSKWEPKK